MSPMLQKKSPGGRRGFYLHTHWEGVRFKAEPVRNPLLQIPGIMPFARLQNGGIIGADGPAAISLKPETAVEIPRDRVVLRLQNTRGCWTVRILLP